MVKFFTEDYWNALAQGLNNDSKFKQDTKDLDTSMLNVCKDKNEAYLLTIKNGTASAQRAAADTPAEFKLTGNYNAWVETAKGKSLNMQVMSGRIQFQGSIQKILSLQSKLASIERITQILPKEYEWQLRPSSHGNGHSHLP
jgi:putative sterol carrier protein